MLFQENIPLAPLTTFKLGGPAKKYCVIKTIEDMLSALRFASETSIKTYVLGGGSNTIFMDSGYDGFVLHMLIPGIRCLDSTDSYAIYRVGAGVVWDDFVRFTVEQGLAGIEALSGIPGSVGASPIQNIGAYGQEVKDTILSVETVSTNGEREEINNKDCNFSYRNSIFKSGIKSKSIVTYVNFKLSKVDPPCFRYPEVAKFKHELEAKFYVKEDDENTSEKKEDQILEKRIQIFQEYRNLILSLRRKKSMVLDESDYNTRSVGSFFINPILNDKEIQKFLNRLKELSIQPPQIFPEGQGFSKISAAWLIEHSGLQKGSKFPGGVGISENHCLALVNIDGSTKALLEMATQIREQVFQKFSIHLEKEPVLCS